MVDVFAAVGDRVLRLAQPGDEEKAPPPPTSICTVASEVMDPNSVAVIIAAALNKFDRRLQ